MRIECEGKVAVVTGGTRNIGLATSKALAKSGATVACCYAHNESAAREAVAGIKADGGDAVAYRLDVASVEDIRTQFGRIAAELGDVSILVNNAAVRPRHRIDEIEPADFDAVVAVNQRGPFFCAQAVLPAMRANGWGRIVNLSGGTAYFGAVARAHVVSTKLGIVGLSRGLAVETATWGVTVNTVVPGSIGTERGEADPLATEAGAHLDQIPIGRQGTPDEVAAAVLYLCSEEAGYVTGQELKVTGGRAPLSRQPWAEY
jgi:NAD(P)-dependent dehydrogenase (short-subunit alcohol dehydrogenase family)